MATGKSSVKISRGLKVMMREMKNFDAKKTGMWRLATNHTTAAIQKNFRAQGRPKWTALSPEYAAWKKGAYTATGRKAKRRPRRGATEILQLTQRLRKAATGSRAHGFRKREGKRRLTLGISGIPYAARHNYGHRDEGARGRGPTPKREYFVDERGRPAMTKPEEREMLRAMKAQLIQHQQQTLDRGSL